MNRIDSVTLAADDLCEDGFDNENCYAWMAGKGEKADESLLVRHDSSLLQSHGHVNWTLPRGCEIEIIERTKRCALGS